MDMQGLLAVLEEEKADLLGRREARFVPVPLTGVQLEVLQSFLHNDLFVNSSVKSSLCEHAPKLVKQPI